MSVCIALAAREVPRFARVLVRAVASVEGEAEYVPLRMIEPKVLDHRTLLSVEQLKAIVLTVERGGEKDSSGSCQLNLLAFT